MSPFATASKNGTSRLGQMMAIVETAVSETGSELRKSPLEHPFSQVIQAEFLKARRVDDGGIVIDLVHPGERSGMFPRVQHSGNFTCGNIGTRYMPG